MMQANTNNIAWYERAYDLMLPTGLDMTTKLNCILILIMCLFSIVTNMYNLGHARYLAGPDLDLIRQVFGIWILYRFSALIPYKYPRQLSEALCFTLLCLAGAYIAAGAISATPSAHLLNWSLLHIDLKMGFHQLAIMNWVQHYPWFVKILHMAYNAWFAQFLLIPVALALFSETKEIATWTLATLLSVFIGGLIYYFLPSSSPASVLNSPYFPSSCYQCIAHFYALRHWLDIPSNGCGLIDFPSFHVIDAVLNFLAIRKIKIVAIPLFIINSVLIASTLLLGYHFLIDVIAGFAIALLTYYVAQLVSKK